MSNSEHTTDTPPQSPFFRAVESARYERQDQIRRYEIATGRSLIVFWGPIEPLVITPFADAIGDVPPAAAFDLMLVSLGGDGETAMRMAAMCHAGRVDFRVVVPDIAASAATLLALAAESILMSDTSTLGPVDPQLWFPARERLVPAKEIITIIDDLDERVQNNPHAFEFYSALLVDIDGIIYQTAKSALERNNELIPEALGLRQPALADDKIDQIKDNLRSLSTHSATIGHKKAKTLGLPAVYAAPQEQDWDLLWRLHTHYASSLGPYPRSNLIEGQRVSFHFNETRS